MDSWGHVISYCAAQAMAIVGLALALLILVALINPQDPDPPGAA